jgi:hypothetical protein
MLPSLDYSILRFLHGLDDKRTSGADGRFSSTATNGNFLCSVKAVTALGGGTKILPAD